MYSSFLCWISILKKKLAMYSSCLTTASPPSVCLRIRKGLIMSLEQRLLFVFAGPINNLTSESSLILTEQSSS